MSHISPALARCKSISAELKEIAQLAEGGLELGRDELAGQNSRSSFQKITDHTGCIAKHVQALQQYIAELQKVAYRQQRFHQPSDVIREIFLHVLPPEHLLESTLARGYNSPWCQNLRMKKSLSSVCWAWRDVGIQFLYKDVVIRRIGQVPALFDVLRNPSITYDLAGLIRNLTIACYVPAICQQVFKDDMTEILKLCRNLKHLAVDMFCDALDFGAQMPSWNVIPSNITYLDVGRNVDFQAALPLLVLCANSIQSLHLAEVPVTGKEPGSPIAIELPQLRILELGGRITPIAEQIKSFAIRWTMPNLNTLKLGYYDDWTSFLEVHGRKLKRLALAGSRVSVENLIRHCRSLEHLVIPYDSTFFPRVSFPALKYIDFLVLDSMKSCRCSENNAPSSRPRLKRMSHVQSLLPLRFLPHLRSVRVFHSSLGLDTNLPFEIPPGDETKDFEIHYTGLRIVCRTGNIFNTVPHWSYQLLESNWEYSPEPNADDSMDDESANDESEDDESKGDESEDDESEDESKDDQSEDGSRDNEYEYEGESDESEGNRHEEDENEGDEDEGEGRQTQLDHESVLQIFGDILQWEGVDE